MEHVIGTLGWCDLKHQLFELIKRLGIGTDQHQVAIVVEFNPYWGSLSWWITKTSASLPRPPAI